MKFIEKLLKIFRPRLVPKEGIQPLSLDFAKKINLNENIFKFTEETGG